MGLKPPYPTNSMESRGKKEGEEEERKKEGRRKGGWRKKKGDEPPPPPPKSKSWIHHCSLPRCCSKKICTTSAPPVWEAKLLYKVCSTTLRLK